MSARPRPLSPHLQVYRWQMTSVLSILHRGTGLFLVLGSVMIAFWVVALALGHNIFASYQAWLGSLVGKVLLAGWSSVFPLGQRYSSFIVGCRMGLRNQASLYHGLDCGFVIGGFDGIAVAFAGARLAC